MTVFLYSGFMYSTYEGDTQHPGGATGGLKGLLIAMRLFRHIKL